MPYISFILNAINPTIIENMKYKVIVSIAMGNNV